MPTTGMKYWELIAAGLHRKGWSYGMVSYWNRTGRLMHCVDTTRDGKRLTVHSDDILTAFLELEMAIAQHERDEPS